MNYTITLTKDKYYKAALKVVNCFLNLTDYELEIIVLMMNYEIKSITKESRKQLRQLLNKDSYNFNNYIKRLKGKQALIEINGDLVINPSIIKSISDKDISVKFKISDEYQDN